MAMKRIFMLPFSITSAVKKKGVTYWLVYWYIYIYLRVKRLFKEKRIPKYDYLADGEPEKLAFFIPKQEEILEYPKRHLDNEERDSVYCFGVNSKSECLSVRLTHLSKKTVQCSLSLRLSDGRTFCLPEEHSSQMRTDELDTFGSSRFKMQCILPMRKWRIFFNGLLREVRQDEENSTPIYRHVIIAVLFNPSAGVFDFLDDTPIERLAEIAASNISPWKINMTSFFEKLSNHFNMYEQPGMLLGTVVIDGGQEREINLWGSRGHSVESLKNDEQPGAVDCPWKFYAQIENGTLIQLGEIIVGKHIRAIYGYIMRQNGFIYSVDSCSILHESSDEMRIVCHAETYRYSISTKIGNTVFEDSNNLHSKDKKYTLKQIDVTVKGMSGKGLFHLGSEIQMTKKRFENTLQSDITHSKEFSLPIWNKANASAALSGGKGSSLHHLNNIKEGYSVPKGVIVTTNGYISFTKHGLSKVIGEMEKAAPFLSTKELILKCKETIRIICKENLPNDVRSSVVKNLESEFGKHINDVKFAVRSSATGEDTEQMSAAGQMTTLLGVQGIEKILDAVKMCWASQFDFVAVQYKRQYGQKLNTPMAVVIQEMVPCDVAGVVFSCDPLTGNPGYLSITANYGLGETVVSAAAEPDTIVLKRDLSDNICIDSRAIGSKKIKITMDEIYGVKETEINENESNQCCISDNLALNLGKIVISLEKQFGNARDIEWGISDDKLFLFQCRPVTSIDTETEFEIRNLGTSYLRTETEYLSTANIAEVMPGAMSPLGMDLTFKLHGLAYARFKVNWEGEEMPDSPYYPKRLSYANNHILFCVADGFFKFSESEGDECSDHTKALTIAIFGRIVDDPNLIRVCKDRHSMHKTSGFLDLLLDPLKSLFSKAYMLMLLFFGMQYAKRVAKKIEQVQIPLKKNSSALEILNVIGRNFHQLDIALICHIDISLSISSWNHAILSILVKENGGWSNEVYNDFAYLVSNLTGVESADVPSAVQELARIISKSIDPKKFRNMNIEDALHWLRSSPTDAGEKFRQFLQNHGHRCLKEFDVYSRPWGLKPDGLVKMLQENATKDVKNMPEKKSLSYWELFSNLNIKVGFLNKILLGLALPHCRRGVRSREITKSVAIKSIDKLRNLMDQLSEAMVAEGRIPNKELLYFLDVPEIMKLIETRSPRLVARAFRRWKCHPELNKIIFPEMIRGIPKPVNMAEDFTDTEEGFTMTGIPVSRGIVKATARVVVNLEDAKNIQPGDILIAYTTDIGWSPYFPLLSGVVTELGGLISHGAVVAREYGLPCVVNLHGATRTFKSGDFVLLNGNEGFLKKLKSA